MELNADFSKRVVIHSEQLDWVQSPALGVQRRMLDRIGGEVARATTIVRFAPDATFAPHVHNGGEEFIVLEGVFQDEHGDYPAGTYVRNPPTTAHTPGSDGGCTIFVKLWQFDPEDRNQFRVDMADAARDDSAVLHEDTQETVRYHNLSAGEELAQALPGGGEVLVLSGAITEGGEQLTKGSWLRLPVGADLNVVAGPEGATLWMKAGHIAFARPPAA